MNELVKIVDDESFENEVINSDKPVLVDFWADWCGPCKIISPILDEISRDYVDRLKVVKVNVDESSVVSNKFNIRGIPTLIIFIDGESVAQKTGALTKSQIIKFLSNYI